MSVQKYFIYLVYDGTHHHGWQIQLDDISIQKYLMKVLATLLRRDTEAIGAGRTDAGIHVSLTIIHFSYEGEMLDTDEVAEKLNCLLSQDILVCKVCRVRPSAHTRFGATARAYKYHIITVKYPSNRQCRYRIHDPLNFQKINEAVLTLFHYTNFTNFSKLHTDVETSICKIMHAEWTREDECTRTFIIQTDRFLRNMVRAIADTLLEVGRGKLSVDGFRRITE